jgi:hypothetical protein
VDAGTLSQTLIDLIVEESSGLDNIGRTIVARRIVGVLSGWLPKDKQPPPDMLPPMDESEARRFGAETIEFGKHAGERFDAVPLDYLQWLADASRKTWHNLHRYLRSMRVTEEDELEENA